jgi:signal transduction histidine kinase
MTQGDTGELSLVDLVEVIGKRASTPDAAARTVAELIEATQAIASELELDDALTTVLHVACDLVAARHGVMNVASPDGSLERVVRFGSSKRPARPVDDPPIGIGDDYLGAEIRGADGHYGTLYVTDKRQGPFDVDDEQILDALARMAATMIANARLYEESRLSQRWVAASEEINRRLLSGEMRDNDLSFIAGLVINLADAAFVGLVIPGSKRFSVQYGPLSYNATLDRDAAFAALPGAVNTILANGQDPEEFHKIELDAAEQVTGFGPVLIFPWSESGATAEGAFVVARGSGSYQFSPAERQMAERFVRSVSLARELAAARNDRERVALADERDRIARDLHDHVIQSLFAVGLSLQGLVSSASDKTAARIAAQIEAIDVTIRQIRQTIFQLNSAPSTLAYSQKQRLNQLVRETLEGKGLDSSLEFSGPIDTLIDSRLGDEVAAVIREALSNVVRHADATRVDISVAVSTSQVRVVVTDNGRGLGELARRSGLDNLLSRAKQRGGSFTIAARAPSGTTLDWSVPV